MLADLCSDAQLSMGSGKAGEDASDDDDHGNTVMDSNYTAAECSGCDIKSNGHCPISVAFGETSASQAGTLAQ